VLEARLAAFPPAAPPAGDERSATAPLTANAIVERQPPSGVPVVAAAIPPATVTEQTASKPAPFAFGDFT